MTKTICHVLVFSSFFHKLDIKLSIGRIAAGMLSKSDKSYEHGDSGDEELALGRAHLGLGWKGVHFKKALLARNFVFVIVLFGQNDHLDLEITLERSKVPKIIQKRFKMTAIFVFQIYVSNS